MLCSLQKGVGLAAAYEFCFFNNICSLNSSPGKLGTVSPETVRGLREEVDERALGDSVRRCAGFGRLQVQRQGAIARDWGRNFSVFFDIKDYMLS